jgi:hypothetical protein
MAFWCMFVIRLLILFFGMFKLFNFIIECSCMDPLTPTIIIISGLTFPPLCFRMSISGSRFLLLASMAVSWN